MLLLAYGLMPENLLLKLLTIQTALAQLQINLPLNGGGGGGGGGFRGGSGGGGIELTNPLGTYDLQALLDRIIYYLLLLAAPIVVIMVIWGAFLLVTSAGNPEQIRKGWKTIIYAAVGYGVLILAGGVSYIVQQLISGY